MCMKNTQFSNRQWSLQSKTNDRSYTKSQWKKRGKKIHTQKMQTSKERQLEPKPPEKLKYAGLHTRCIQNCIHKQTKRYSPAICRVLRHTVPLLCGKAGTRQRRLRRDPVGSGWLLLQKKSGEPANMHGWSGAQTRRFTTHGSRY